jgi:O-antigen/teichoic acid export membrane protein
LLLANLSLRTVQATATSSEHRFTDYLFLRLVTCSGALVAIMVAAAIIGGETGLVVLLLGVAKTVDAFSDLCFGLFQRYEQLKHVALSFAVNGVATVALTTLLLKTTGSLLWAVAGSVTASVLALICCASPARHLLARPSLKPVPTSTRGTRFRIVSLARVALPLGVASSLTSLTANVPLYAVHQISGPRALGVFASLAYVGLAANTAISAIAQAVLPRLARMSAEGRRSDALQLLGRLTGISAVVGAVAVGAVLLFGAPALTLLYGAEYGHYVSLLAWIVATTALGAVIWFFDAAVSAARRFGDQLRTGIIVLVVATATAALLVPQAGLQGAVWAAALTALVQCGLKCVFLARYWARSV